METQEILELPDFIGVADMAKLTGLNEETIRRRVRTGSDSLPKTLPRAKGEHAKWNKNDVFKFFSERPS